MYDSTLKFDPKPYPSHLPSGALLILAEAEQELALSATPDVRRVHNVLLGLFPTWDADQRWLIAHMVADAAADRVSS